MSFMNAFITLKQPLLEVDGPMGTETIPLGLLGADITAAEEFLHNFVEGNSRFIPSELALYCENSSAYNVRIYNGYAVRASAAGYMDCTPWEGYKTKKKAMARAREIQRECEGKEV